MIHWTELLVHQTDCNKTPTLENVINNSPGMLASAEISKGKITEWDQHFIAAPGEKPEWNTPRQPVNWAEFQNAIGDGRLWNVTADELGTDSGPWLTNQIVNFAREYNQENPNETPFNLEIGEKNIIDTNLGVIAELENNINVQAS